VSADTTENIYKPTTAFSSAFFNVQSDALTYPCMTKPDVLCALVRDFPECAFYLLNVSQLHNKCTLIREHFLPQMQGGKVAYAVKANPNRHVLNIIANAGIDHFDCASIEEIRLLSNFIPKAQLLYNHPIKHTKDIHEAYQCGIRQFTVQSQDEIDKLLSVTDRDLEVIIRLASHNLDARIPLSEKFGASFESALQMIRSAHERSLRCGLSIHVGSQNTNVEAHLYEIKKIFNLARDVGEVHSINIGGGIPVNCEQMSKHCSKHYLNQVSHTISRHIDGVFRTQKPRIYIEPGRAIVAESIDLLIPVMAKEIRNNQICVYIDDGIFTSFSDAIIHQWRYDFQVFPGEGRYISDKKIPMTVYGRTCDSGDKLSEVYLPENIQAGDYLLLPCAGAYTDSQSTLFNGFRPPKYVLYNFDQR